MQKSVFGPLFFFFNLNSPAAKPITTRRLHIGWQPKIPQTLHCKWENKRVSFEKVDVIHSSGEADGERRRERKDMKEMDNVKESLKRRRTRALRTDDGGEGFSLESQRRSETRASLLCGEGEHSCTFTRSYSDNEKV